MRSYRLPCLAGLLFCAGSGIARADLITNGSFEAPNVGSGYQIFGNGSVPGWNSNNNETEIDDTAILGGPAYAGRQSLELNGNTFDTISQMVGGLNPGDDYTLSWAYGSRPGYGAQQAIISFGGRRVTTDSGTGAAGSLDWSLNSFIVTATAPAELLSFAAVASPAYSQNGGNEIDAVSLKPVAVPEPASLLLLGTAVLGLIHANLKRRKRSRQHAA